MESAARPVACDQSVLDTIAGFLKTAINVYQAAVTLHDVDPSLKSMVSGRDWTRVSDGLSRSIQQMQNLVHSAEISTDHLMCACIKIGQDVSVHLHRVQVLFSNHDADQVDATKFRVLWPRENVDALGSRISDFIQRWRELQTLGR